VSQKQPQQGVKAVAKQVDLNLIGAKDHPLLTASNLVVNFVGTDFLVTVVDAYPEPYTGPSKPLGNKENARVLGRYSFNANQWALVVSSINRQLEEVRKLGILMEVSLPSSEP